MSEQKTLKIKRVFAWSIYGALRNVPPKEYPTTAEIKATIGDILPALRTHVTHYIEMFDKARDLSAKVKNKELSEEEIKAGVDKINDEIGVYSKEHGMDVVDVVVEKDAFSIFSGQFNRENWGKNWVVNIEEYGELLEAFETAAK